MQNNAERTNFTTLMRCLTTELHMHYHLNSVKTTSNGTFFSLTSLLF